MPLIVIGGIRCGTGAVSHFFRQTLESGRWLGDESVISPDLIERLKSGEIIGFKNAKFIYDPELMVAFRGLPNLVFVVVVRDEADRLTSHLASKIDLSVYQDGYEAFEKNRSVLSSLHKFEVNGDRIAVLKDVIPEAEVVVLEYERLRDPETLDILWRLSVRFGAGGIWADRVGSLKQVKPKRVSILNHLPKKIRLRILRYSPNFLAIWLANLASPTLRSRERELYSCIQRLLG